jgi:hypothetical protein
MSPNFLSFDEYEYLSSHVEHNPGLARLDVLGPIGQSCDRQQKIYRITEPDGATSLTMDLFSGVINPPLSGVIEFAK